MYLDPGFGGMLVQILVVIVGVGGAILYSSKRKIKSLFVKDNKVNNTPQVSSKATKNLEDDVVDTLKDDAVDTLAGEE